MLAAARDGARGEKKNGSIERLREQPSSDQAAEAYQKAIQLAQTSTAKQPPSKAQIAGYYANLGNLLGKMGKIEDANKAYEAAAAADPASAGTVWLNSGIVLYKANRLNEAVVPLQKATALIPNNAQAWYLLGASLVASMDVKQEGEKMIPILKPGTVEAYQKCIELDPNGPWGTQAKEGLEQLQAMGAGVETKVKVKKGKS
jgi:tetratricopeptide (TPR) repeat protein